MIDPLRTKLVERARHWLNSNADKPYDAAMEAELDAKHHNDAYELIEAFLALVDTPVLASPPQEVQQSIADMEFARDSHRQWAEHLEAHVASGMPCAECDGKPYKLDATHEREWVAKYDRVLDILEAACTSASPARASARDEWKCRANRTADPPQDCDWPLCGCDPYAEKVVAALQEANLLVAARASAPEGIGESTSDHESAPSAPREIRKTERPRAASAE